jgi:uncharacterized protein (TIGR01777 family)
MRIAVTGSMGLIGSALVADFVADGDTVTRVARRGGHAVRGAVVFWDPAAGWIDAAALEGHDAVIHLAGESIAGWWTEGKKARIRESRVKGTALLSETLARLARPPRTLLCASAVGYYGARPPAEVLDETSPPGTGFLAETVMRWEEATRPAAAAGIRVVNLRFGTVLSREGGALAAMLPLFRLGLGARFGNGEQILSWIARSEVPSIVRHVLAHPDLSGPVNVVSPCPVSNGYFTTALAHALHRPAFLRVPATIARLVLGEMADEMLLSGARAEPRRLLESGYHFLYPELEGALRHELGGATGRVAHGARS